VSFSTPSEPFDHFVQQLHTRMPDFRGARAQGHPPKMGAPPCSCVSHM